MERALGQVLFREFIRRNDPFNSLRLRKYHIRVNAIAPGATPYGSSDEGFVTEGIPLIRTGLPEDQANAAVFLASEESSWMTGQIMVIDGGHALSY